MTRFGQVLAVELFLRRFVVTRLVAVRPEPSMMPAVGRRRVLLRGAALFAFVAALVRLLRAFQSRRRLTAVRERHPSRPAGNEDGEPALVLAMASSLRPPPQIPPDSLQPERCDSSANESLLVAEVAALREQLAAAEGQGAAAEKERAAAVAALEEREVQAESDREGSKAAGEAEEAAKEAAKEAAAEAAQAAQAAQADTSSPSLDTRHSFGESLDTIVSIDQSWPPSLSSSICASPPPPPPSPPLPPAPLPLQTIYSGIDGLRIDVDHANGADGTHGVSPKSLDSLDSLGSLGSLDTPRSATYAYGDTSPDTCVCGSGYRLPVGCIQDLDTCVCGPSMPSSPPASADIGTVCSLPRSTANESTSPLADTPRQRRTAVFRPLRGRADPEV